MRIISFDLDGTLIDRSFADAFWEEEVPRLYAEKNSLTVDDARKIVKRYYDEIGEEDIRWYQPEYWFRLLDLEEDVSEVLNRVKNRVNVFSDALDTIEKLYQRHDLIVVSNAPREFIEVGLNRIKHRFTRIFSCTSDFGMVKKSEEAYLRICREIGVPPKDIIHVGDHPEFDYEIPRRIGIRAFLVDRTNNNHGKRSIEDMRELLKIL
ncbi:MAG: HAD family hydrolase [Candidatus Syntropharchaeia archaeon]